MVRERIFGFGEDYWIQDEYGQRVFFVDGKVLRIRQTFELKTLDGRQAAVLHKKAIAVRDTMLIERDHHRLATVRKKLISPIHHSFHVELADGQEWTAKGGILEKEYEIGDGRTRIAEISRKWFRLRDTYAVSADPYAVDLALVLSVAVAVETLIHDEQQERERHGG